MAGITHKLIFSHDLTDILIIRYLKYPNPIEATENN